MKKIIISAFVFAALMSCDEAKVQEKVEETATELENVLDSEFISEGEKITADGAISTPEFLAQMQEKGGLEAVKVDAKINSCCQKKGCWMMVDLGNGEEMRVKFKDYGFFVPKNAGGKNVIMQGNAYMDTTTIAELQHYAEDGGATKEEIEAITEPKISLAFEATGVLIK
jgi:hypothetical protein